MASAGGAAHLFGEFHHRGRIDAGVGGACKRIVREREANRGQVALASRFMNAGDFWAMATFTSPDRRAPAWKASLT